MSTNNVATTMSTLRIIKYQHDSTEAKNIRAIIDKYSGTFRFSYVTNKPGLWCVVCDAELTSAAPEIVKIHVKSEHHRNAFRQFYLKNSCMMPKATLKIAERTEGLLYGVKVNLNDIGGVFTNNIISLGPVGLHCNVCNVALTDSLVGVLQHLQEKKHKENVLKMATLPVTDTNISEKTVPDLNENFFPPEQIILADLVANNSTVLSTNDGNEFICKPCTLCLPNIPSRVKRHLSTKTHLRNVVYFEHNKQVVAKENKVSKKQVVTKRAKRIADALAIAFGMKEAVNGEE